LRELRKLGFHFRRQVPIDGFIVDFACYHPKVAIEIDGSQHGFPEATAKDSRRDAYLTQSGFKLLRFWNRDIDRNLADLMDMIRLALEEPPTPAPQSGAVPPRKGEGSG
jgi:very-short-patch-repair endonuclease